MLDAWLSAHGADHVWIISLGQEDDLLPFALVLPRLDLIPARFTASHLSRIPSFASPWFDADRMSFSDPSSLMTVNYFLIMP